MAFNCFSVVIAFAVVIAGIKSSCHAWNYDGADGDLGPNDWRYNYTMCGESSQSPIDINTTTLTITTGGLSFSGYDTSPTSRNYSLVNTGHTAQVNVNVKTISVRCSRLNGTYVLEQFHFHWRVFRNGSEHSVNGEFYPLELHLVHYNSDKYDNVSHAASSNDSSALLVLGIFGVEAPSGVNPSTTLESLVNHLNEVPYKNNRSSFASFPVESLLPCQSSTIYTYSGSLTSPPCAQDVDWNIFAQPIYISGEELEKFRHLHGAVLTEELVQTSRPIQPLNNRTVYGYSTPSPCKVLTTTTVVSAIDSSTSSTSSLHSRKMMATVQACVVISMTILSAVLF